jgi:hypothetical protein
MDLDIASGSAKVIKSGSVFSFGKNPLIFQLEGLKLILEFKDEVDNDGKPIEKFSKKTEIIDEKTIKLTFINYNNSLGIGAIEPFRIGTIDDKALYFNYTIYGSTSRNSKNVQYTLFLVDQPGGILKESMMVKNK